MNKFQQKCIRFFVQTLFSSRHADFFVKLHGYDMTFLV